MRLHLLHDPTRGTPGEALEMMDHVHLIVVIQFVRNCRPLRTTHASHSERPLKPSDTRQALRAKPRISKRLPLELTNTDSSLSGNLLNGCWRTWGE